MLRFFSNCLKTGLEMHKICHKFDPSVRYLNEVFRCHFNTELFANWTDFNHLNCNTSPVLGWDRYCSFKSCFYDLFISFEVILL